jgi:hypothetical protein
MERYGLGGQDQTDLNVVAQAMAVRIGTVLTECQDCHPIDKLIISGMAQNGDFLTPSDVRKIVNGDYASNGNDKIPGNIDWNKAINNVLGPSKKGGLIGHQANGLDVDTQFMVTLFLRDMVELHKENPERDLPYGLTESDLTETIKYMITDVDVKYNKSEDTE